uniref:sulfurtransferase n=1 Tax=Thaumasiovibrio occultus TaxID=1891184 RepID=UPI000B35F21E|nr:rhodanese-like domain-containing protein [Thaumasiovibrio occultus]
MSTNMTSTGVVNTDWLKSNLSRPDVKVLDASWFMPGSERDPLSEFIQTRIPGAQFFDFDQKIKNASSPLPHMLPSETLFSQAVSAMGITNDDEIVVYDSQGVFSSPRVWWMFKAMGHTRVAILNGGLPAWLKENGDVETGEPLTVTPNNYQAVFQPQWVVDAAQVNELRQDDEAVVLDARSSARFFGQASEPRPEVRSGHMPGSRNLPFGQLVKNGAMLAPEKLATRFAAFADNEQQLVMSCGSGITACILALGAYQAGYRKLAVYDGSWTEWGGDSLWPVVTQS